MLKPIHPDLAIRARLGPATAELVREVRHKHGYTAREFASLVGVSVRTVHRYASRGQLSPYSVLQLVRNVHPKDPELAGRLAASVGVSFAELGLAESAPAAAAVVRKASREQLDSAILAAAEAMNAPPGSVRIGIAALFKRLSELEVDLPAVAEQLATWSKR